MERVDILGFGGQHTSVQIAGGITVQLARNQCPDRSGIHNAPDAAFRTKDTLTHGWALSLLIAHRLVSTAFPESCAEQAEGE